MIMEKKLIIIDDSFGLFITTSTSLECHIVDIFGLLSVAL
jgi:hypothetical protein